MSGCVVCGGLYGTVLECMGLYGGVGGLYGVACD